MRLTLEFSPNSLLPVNLRGLTPEWALAAPTQEILHYKAPIGNQPVALGEICRLTRDPTGRDELVLAGETIRLHHAGSGLAGGYMRIVGDCGRWAGSDMQAGELVIEGNAGDGLGAGMRGGRIHCEKNAGHYAGAAQPGRKQGMTGGVLTIGGNAGREVGTGMRRGILVVGHDAGELLGVQMLAGSIFVLGQAGENPGLNMHRGSLVVDRLAGKAPAGFTPTGRGDSVWLRLYLRYITGLGIPIPEEWMHNIWNRYCGDRLGLGKGEIYTHDPVE